MLETNPEIIELVNRAKAGDDAGLGELFLLYKDQLKRMIEFRMDQKS